MTADAPTNAPAPAGMVGEEEIKRILFRLQADFADGFRHEHDGIATFAARSILALFAPLAQEVERLRGEGWQPIETAPKDGTTILIAHERAVFDGYWSEPGNGWVDGDEALSGDLITYLVTHWRPLPAPPTAIRAGEKE